MTKKALLWLSLTAGTSVFIGGVIFISLPAPPPIDCGNVLCAQCPDGYAHAPTPDNCCACAPNTQ